MIIYVYDYACIYDYIYVYMIIYDYILIIYDCMWLYIILYVYMNAYMYICIFYVYDAYANMYIYVYSRSPKKSERQHVTWVMIAFH